MRGTLYILILLFLQGTWLITAQVRYIDRIIEYTPAPGQFINASPGLPENAESIVGGINGLVSLGFFGGYIVVGFDDPIPNHPDNPYGVDFTVFGNGHFNSSEPGIVMVMKDENGNGEPDDTWYELRGSDHFLSTTVPGYRITYSNPGGYYDVPWVDNKDETGIVMINTFHQQPYYPSAVNFPNIDQTSYSLSGTKLKDKTFQTTTWVHAGFDYGYADNRPVNHLYPKPHDVPDNPYTLDVQEGTGGDAFDIGWAVDTDGNPVHLDEIDFIKIYTGVAANAGVIGEASPEIRGIAVVKPDASVTGPTDVIVSNHPPLWRQFSLSREFEWPQGQPFQFEAYVVSKGHLNSNQNIIWKTNNPAIATISASGTLTGQSTGKTDITATWQADNSVSRLFTIHITPATSTGNQPDVKNIRLYPNPATNYISVKGAVRGTISIYNAAGVKVMEVKNLSEVNRIHISHLPKGLYMAQIKAENTVTTTKFLKQ